MAQIIDKQKLSDGAIAVLLRPDGVMDATHDSWRTFYVQPTTTNTDVENWVTAQKADVEAQYAAVSNAVNLLDGLK